MLGSFFGSLAAGAVYFAFTRYGAAVGAWVFTAEFLGLGLMSMGGRVRRQMSARPSSPSAPAGNR